VLDQYPLQSLDKIDVPGADDARNDQMLAEAEPITEQKTITADYRMTKIDENRVSFAPVQRVQRLDGGGMTELVDLEIILHNDKLRQDFGGMKIGDQKEFTLTVNVLTGYRLPGQTPRGDSSS
jgi:hypothetical protein